MANEVSIIVRARDATRGGFAGLDRSLSGLQGRLRSTTQDSSRLNRELGRLGSHGLGGLRQGMRGMDAGVFRLFNGFSRLTGVMGDNKLMSAKVAAGMLLLGPAAQGAAAALTVGLGAAFIGLGAYALKGDREVRGAFRSMKEGISSSVRDAAQPLKPFLIDGMRTVRGEAQRMRPALSRAFAAAGPLVAPLARGITGLASNALPGLTQALRSSRPAMLGFEVAMKQLGRGIGEMFTNMTAGDRGRALQQVWAVLGSEARRLMGTLGGFLGSAAQSESAMLALVGSFRTLGTVLRVVEGTFAAVDGVLGGLFSKMLGGAADVQAIASQVDGLGGSGGKAKQTLSELRAELRDLNREISQQRKVVDMDIPGPAGGRAKDRLDDMLSQRAALEQRIAKASREAAAATRSEARSVRELMSALQRLNERVRGELDAQSGFEQAVDDAAEAARKHAGALRMVNGRLDLNSQAARDAYGPLSELAAKTQEAGEAATKNGSSWSRVNGIWSRGRRALIETGQQMGLTRRQAERLASQILKTPNKTAYLRGHIADLEKKLNKAKGELKSVPASKRSQLKGHIADLQRKIDAAQRELKGVPSSKVSQLRGTISDLTRKIADAKARLKSVPASKRSALLATISDLQAKVRAARAELASLRDRTVTVTVRPFYVRPSLPPFYIRARAHGGIVGAAGGGPRSSMTLVGEQGPELVRLPFGSRVIPAPRTKSILKSEREAIKEARGDLSISHFGWMAGARRTEFRNAIGRPDSVSALVGALNQWRGRIQRGTHGTAERRLLRDLDVAGRALIKNERLQTRVNSALEKARDKLSELRSAAAQLKESVESGIRGSGNVTRAAGDRSWTTVDLTIDHLRSTRDQAKSFAGALGTLKRRGLSAQILGDIAGAGLEGGGLMTAQALTSATRTDIKTLNLLQGQINAYARQAGKTTSDAMYGAGIKAAEGVVKGLERNRDRIARAMDKLAEALAKAVRKGLGVRGRATGGIIGAAGGGPRSAMTLVGEWGPELVHLPYGSRVRSNPDTRRLASAPGAGSDRPIVIHLDLAGSRVAELLIDPLRKEIRKRGGDVQVVLGR